MNLAHKMGGCRVVHTALRSLTCRTCSILATVGTSSSVGLTSLGMSNNTDTGGFLVRARTSLVGTPIRHPIYIRAATVKTTCLTKLTMNC